MKTRKTRFRKHNKKKVDETRFPSSSSLQVAQSSVGFPIRVYQPLEKAHFLHVSELSQPLWCSKRSISRSCLPQACIPMRGMHRNHIPLYSLLDNLPPLLLDTTPKKLCTTYTGFHPISYSHSFIAKSTCEMRCSKKIAALAALAVPCASAASLADLPSCAVSSVSKSNSRRNILTISSSKLPLQGYQAPVVVRRTTAVSVAQPPSSPRSNPKSRQNVAPATTKVSPSHPVPEREGQLLTMIDQRH